jgi:hypothetical protein
VGLSPTSSSAPADRTKGSTSTTACVASTCTTFCRSHLPHMLQLCPYRPLCTRVSCSEEESSYMPHQHSISWPTQTGRVNYTTMEEIPEGDQVLAGMFSLNGYPAIVLFDSGATHYFISKACTQKCQLTIQHINTTYMIRTPRGKIITKQMVMHAPLSLAERIYKPSLIVLEGQGIDVILGIGWMKTHKTLLDTAA